MRTRLGVMMFLQYAIWGAWAPVLWPYLTTTVGLTQAEAGWIFSALWLACMLAPFTGGQVADRWLPTQTFLGVAHLAGGAALLVLGTSRTTGPGAFGNWITWMGIYALLYAPTLALTNSLALRHLASDAEFGRVRVFGTIGWVASGAALSAWRNGWFGAVPPPGDCVLLAGSASLVMGAYCFTLPPTPPAKAGADPLAFREALVLLRDRNTLAFLAIGFVVTTELQFYYGPTGSFLEQALGIAAANVPVTMSVAQVAEIVAMAVAFPLAMRRLGVARTLAIGAIAWPLRYAVFALAPLGPIQVMRPLVIASLALHGVGFTFFFVGSQVFIDRVSPADIRGSVQSLLTLVTLGAGNFLGTLFTAAVMTRFTSGSGDAARTSWSIVFTVPCVLTVACAVAFILFVRDPAPAAAAEVAS